MCQDCFIRLFLSDPTAVVVNCSSCGAEITVDTTTDPKPCPVCGGRAHIELTPEEAAEAHKVAAEFSQRIHDTLN